MNRPSDMRVRAGQPLIGIDLGGTKIEGILLAPGTAGGGRDQILARKRIATPNSDYAGTINAIRDLVRVLETDLDPPSTSTHQGRSGGGLPVGIGMPGSIAPRSGLVQNANSTWLNGKAFMRDLHDAMGRDIRCANDANCFALSEALDGAGIGARTVFGVILGTGCGGGIVVDKKLLDGPRAIGGEWGHNPLPWPQVIAAQKDEEAEAGVTFPSNELPGPQCWCGRHGCMETWVSGPALSADHERHTSERLDAQIIADRAGKRSTGSALQHKQARQSLDRHALRLARGLAAIVNVIDPDVIVLGGGLSKLVHLYDELPGLMAPFIFAEDHSVSIKPPKWGDASGVRGAAWLWNPTNTGE